MRHWSETERCHHMRHLVWNRNKDSVTWDTWSETGHSNERNLVWNRNKDEATWVTWSEAQRQDARHLVWNRKKRCSDVKQKQRHLVWNKNKDTWCETEIKTPGVKQKQKCSDVRHLVWNRNKDAATWNTWSEKEKKERCSDVRQRTRCYSLRSATEVFITSETLPWHFQPWRLYCLYSLCCL